MPHRPARMLTGPRSVSNNDIHVATPPKSGMIRAYSQDSNIVLETLGRAKAHATTSSSDPSLEGAARLPSRSSTRELQYGSIEEDVCSTDSSLMEDDVKKKKRKLFSFAKKNKTKGDWAGTYFIYYYFLIIYLDWIVIFIPPQDTFNY